MQEKIQKYPVFQTFSQSFLMLTDNFMAFLKPALVCAALMSLLSFVFKQPFVCLLIGLREKVSCGANTPLYIFYLLLKLFILSSFLRIWADKIYLKKEINLLYFKTNLMRFLKFFGGSFVFLIINALPLLSLYCLIIRTPNPVWQIEILYFTFVSLGFIVPFVVLRFYANIALAIEGLPFTDFKQTYQKTNFQVSRILTAFTFVLASLLFLFLIIQTNLRRHIFAPFYAYNIFSEYLFECTLLFVVTVMFNFIMIQKQTVQSLS